MGIRGAWSFFRKSFQTIDPSSIEPLNIGIDMFSLVYTHRANLHELLDLLKVWASHGHTMTCIWDGTAPKEKQEIIGQRRNARESAMDKKGELEEYLTNFGDQLTDNDRKNIKTAITSLSWQGWHLTGTLKKEIQDALGTSIKHIYATGEADDLLIEMTKDNKVSVILSLDSDIFAMGAERVWRLLRIRGEWIIEDISVESVCNTWDISLAQLQDACFLAGWDRCHLTGGSYMPFGTAVNRIKYYLTWSTVLEKFPPEGGVDMAAVERLNVIKKESRARWVDILKNRSTEVRT